MADATGEDGSTSVDHEILRRAGLTVREAKRLSEIEELRSNTASVWDSSFPGMIMWTLWRLLLKGFQPVWLIASLGAAAWFAGHMVDQAGGIRAVSEPPPSLADRVTHAVQASTDPSSSSWQRWQDELEVALNGDGRRRPDIDRFNAWITLAPDLIGRDQLALHDLSGNLSPARWDLRTRALPVWEREHRYDATIEARHQQARIQDLMPWPRVYVPADLQSRYQNAYLNWAIAHSSADRFFKRQSHGQLNLQSLPGLVEDSRRPIRLMGGVRELISQACAYDIQAPYQRVRMIEVEETTDVVEQEGDAVGDEGAVEEVEREVIESIDPCRASIIADVEPDGLSLGLSALEAGLADIGLPASVAHDGAQVLSVARAAGRLDPAFERHLDELVAVALPPQEVIAALAGSGVRLDMAYAAPARAHDGLSGKYPHRTGTGMAELARIVEGLARLRRSRSVPVAARLVPAIHETRDVDRLERLSSAVGERLFGLYLALGRDMFNLLEEPSERPPLDTQLLYRLLAALASAAFVLLLALIRMSHAPLVRRSSRLNVIDARLCRLFLGRKS